MQQQQSKQQHQETNIHRQQTSQQQQQQGTARIATNDSSMQQAWSPRRGRPRACNTPGET